MSKSVSVSCRGAGSLPLSKINPLQGELKALSKKNFDRLKGLIMKNGITAPIHVWKDPKGKFWNLDGHQRARVLDQIQKEGTAVPPVPVVFVEATSPKHAKEILLSNVSQFGEVSEESLYEFMHEADIKFEDFKIDFDIPGINANHFGEGYFKDVMFVARDKKEDDIPIVKEKAVVKPGQLFKLGDHRLLCGDSTKIADVMRLLDGQKAHVVITGPPYNINCGNIKHPKFKSREITNDNMNKDDFRTFCQAFSKSIEAGTDGCVYVFGPPGADGRIMFTVLDETFHCSTTVIWNKDRFTLGRGKYQNKYEPCWFGWVKDGGSFTDDRTLTNVWDVVWPAQSDLHPTMKPVELIEKAIAHSTQEGDRVLDIFGGSGTTMIACEKTNRSALLVELEPTYCDVIIKRWEKWTGKKAELISDAPNKQMIKMKKSKKPSVADARA